MDKMSHRLSSTKTAKMLFIHFFLCGIGLIGFIRHVTNFLILYIAEPYNAFITYADWAIPHGMGKTTELLLYLLSVPSLVFYYLLTAVFIKKYQGKFTAAIGSYLHTRTSIITYFSLMIIINASIISCSSRFGLIFAPVWLITIAAPIFSIHYDLFIRINQNLISKGKLSLISILLVLAAILIFSFYPFISAKMPFSNDYMDIPEQTILSTGLVDNTEYINKHAIGGLNKYDPRTGKNPSFRESDYIRIDSNITISNLVQKNPRIFFYDEVKKALVVKGKLSREDADRLVLSAKTQNERNIILNYYFQQKSTDEADQYLNPEEIEFIKKNRRELQDQAKAGHYFHHQNSILGAINEYVLGKPKDKIVFLYGWLSTIVVAELIKAFDGISFESFQTIFYAFYPLYYFLMFLLSVVIFRKINYVLFVAVVSIASIYMLRFDVVRFAPGFNPIRHFLDFISLVFFYWYLFHSKRRLFCLCMAFLSAIIGVLFCKEFGFPLLFSLQFVVALIILENLNSSIRTLILLILSIFCSLAVILFVKTAPNPTFIYLLMGVAAPGFAYIKLLLWLISFGSFSAFLFINWNKENKWKYLTLFWFLYAQGIFIYYVWNPSQNHFWSIAPIFGILIALILKWGAESFPVYKSRENEVVTLITVLSLIFLLIPGALLFFHDQHDYNKIFDNHKIYKWNFPRAKFLSTMDPAVFEDAIRLINKYSPDNSIYLLSKYDNILPFLSEKYNRFPYIEIGLSLVTKKEIDNCIKTIKEDLPEIIFVDTDMERSHLGDVFSFRRLNPFYSNFETAMDASRGRAMMLDNFSNIFSEIKSLYEPLELGNLITVYRLRNYNQ